VCKRRQCACDSWRGTLCLHGEFKVRCLYLRHVHAHINLHNLHILWYYEQERHWSQTSLLLPLAGCKHVICLLLIPKHAEGAYYPEIRWGGGQYSISSLFSHPLYSSISLYFPNFALLLPPPLPSQNISFPPLLAKMHLGWSCFHSGVWVGAPAKVEFGALQRQKSLAKIIT